MSVPHPVMPYRRLGASGLRVSALSFGSWVTFDTQMDLDPVLGCMQAAHDAGCNLFDNAEAYAGGRSETLMGEALAQLGWPRWSYVLTELGCNIGDEFGAFDRGRIHADLVGSGP